MAATRVAADEAWALTDDEARAVTTVTAPGIMFSRHTCAALWNGARVSVRRSLPNDRQVKVCPPFTMSDEDATRLGLAMGWLLRWDREFAA